MPKIYLKDVILHGKTFCCCLPVRFGVISMSFLGIIFGGLLSILLWFEVSDTSSTMDPTERTAFIIAGLVETLLLVASVLGFVGAVVRKQLFTQIYAYFIYVHFLINVGVAAYFLYVITHFSSTATTKLCDDTVKNSGEQSQCTGAFSDLTYVIIVIAVVVLLTELYGALIVARYVHQIKTEKRVTRNSRMMMLNQAGRSTGRSSMMPNFGGSGFGGSGQYSALPGDQSDDISLLPRSPPTGEFNPYINAEHPRFPSYATSAYDEAPTFEEGYGGGSWSHDQIAQDEKPAAQQEQHSDDNNVYDRDLKTATGPSVRPEVEVDPLPRYDNPSELQ